MGSGATSPPISHAAALSSLNSKSLERSTSTPRSTASQGQPNLSPQSSKTTGQNGWVMARISRIPSAAWNRQSVQILADFNSFGEPQTSRSRRSYDLDEEELGISNSRSEHVRPSSAGSSYSLDKALPEPPYHVFSLSKKKQLVYIVSLAGLFSPLSSNIYFPALGQISKVCIYTS
jgi:hypothetical protein